MTLFITAFYFILEEVPLEYPRAVLSTSQPTAKQGYHHKPRDHIWFPRGSQPR